MADIATIVTSAAVGSLASSVMAMVAQALERRSRRRELLLNKAIELAVEKRKFIVQVAKESGRGATFRDDVAIAAELFTVLESILDKGEVTPAFRDKEDQNRSRLVQEKAREAGLKRVPPPGDPED